MKLLHIDSSVLGNQSISREVTAAIVARWRDRVANLKVEVLDLDQDPIRHLNGATLSGSDEMGQARSNAALQQFLATDIIVLGAPMYNFGIASTLKAWIDRIAVNGQTFRYTEAGPEGLAGGKRVVVALSSGGLHAGQASDFVEPYLRHVLGFLGITDLEFVRVDGVGLSPAHRDTALRIALGAIPEPLRAAA